MKNPKRIRIAEYVTCGPVAQKDVRKARDRQGWSFIAERMVACPANPPLKHHRVLYKNDHGIFLKEQVCGGCNCSREHWHVRLLADVQLERKAAEMAKREMKVIDKANGILYKRVLESGAFTLGL